MAARTTPKTPPARTESDLVEAAFGNVTVRVAPPSAKDLTRNLEASATAARAMAKALRKPFRPIDRKKGIPLFFAHPEHPEQLIRELDGVREVGRLKDGKFVIEGSAGTATKRTRGRTAAAE